MTKGIPFIVSAPSGAGKTTLCNMAISHFALMHYSISYTTRTPREGELDGVDYRFVDDAAFTGMIERGEFLEHAVVHGKRYGTAKKDIDDMMERGLDVILDIDVQGAECVRNRIDGGVYIFVLPPSLEACEQRIRARGKDSDEAIKRRIMIAVGEIKQAINYDYIIINERLEDAFEGLMSVIRAEKCKRERMAATVEKLFGAK